MSRLLCDDKKVVFKWLAACIRFSKHTLSERTVGLRPTSAGPIFSGARKDSRFQSFPGFDAQPQGAGCPIDLPAVASEPLRAVGQILAPQPRLSNVGTDQDQTRRAPREARARRVPVAPIPVRINPKYVPCWPPHQMPAR